VLFERGDGGGGLADDCGRGRERAEVQGSGGTRFAGVVELRDAEGVLAVRFEFLDFRFDFFALRAVVFFDGSGGRTFAVLAIGKLVGGFFAFLQRVQFGVQDCGGGGDGFRFAGVGRFRAIAVVKVSVVLVAVRPSGFRRAGRPRIWCAAAGRSFR